MNTFRPKREEVVKAAAPPQKVQRNKAKAKPQSAPPQRRPVQRKGVVKGVKAAHKAFESVFGGGILRKVNIRENWQFILTLVLMVIILIYSNLKVQSKREQITKLTQEITIAKDEAMDAIEEGYSIDKQKEREVLQEGEERGFSNSGYIPYIVEAEKK
jgi:hypothetical protein